MKLWLHNTAQDADRVRREECDFVSNVRAPSRLLRNDTVTAIPQNSLAAAVAAQFKDVSVIHAPPMKLLPLEAQMLIHARALDIQLLPHGSMLAWCVRVS